MEIDFLSSCYFLRLYVFSINSIFACRNYQFLHRFNFRSDPIYIVVTSESNIHVPDMTGNGIMFAATFLLEISDENTSLSKD